MLDGSPAIFRQANFSSQDSLRRRCAQANDDGRPDHLDFNFQPRTAGVHLQRAWLLMNAPFSALFKFEMLDNVRHIHLSSIDSSVGQCPIEQLARRSDKGKTLPILFVTRLLSYKNDSSRLRPLSKNALSRMPIEVAAAALL